MLHGSPMEALGLLSLSFTHFYFISTLRVWRLAQSSFSDPPLDGRRIFLEETEFFLFLAQRRVGEGVLFFAIIHRRGCTMTGFGEGRGVCKQHEAS